MMGGKREERCFNASEAEEDMRGTHNAVVARSSRVVGTKFTAV